MIELITVAIIFLIIGLMMGSTSYKSKEENFERDTEKPYESAKQIAKERIELKKYWKNILEDKTIPERKITKEELLDIWSDDKFFGNTTRGDGRFLGMLSGKKIILK